MNNDMRDTTSDIETPTISIVLVPVAISFIN